MGRKTLKEQITSDDIFKFTNNGLDIFEREIGSFSLTRNILSPIRNEKDPSFRIKQSSTSGLYIGVDYTTGEVFNGITLVARLYNLTYSEAMDKIAWDFKLSSKKVEGEKIKMITGKVIKPTESILYEFEHRPFTKLDHEYWNKGHLTEEFLASMDIFSASKIAINRKITMTPSGEMCFVYVPKDLEYGKLKILRIGESVNKSQKWRTNIHRDYYFYMDDIKNEDPIFIAKSNKDAAINKILGYNSIVSMSENPVVFIDNLEKVKERFPNNQLILNWGIDKDALEKTKLIEEETGINVFKIPKVLGRLDINDNFEYVSEFGLDKYKQKLENYLEKWQK